MKTNKNLTYYHIPTSSFHKESELSDSNSIMMLSNVAMSRWTSIFREHGCSLDLSALAGKRLGDRGRFHLHCSFSVVIF